MGSPLEVDTAAVRRAAGQVEEASGQLDRARSTEAPHLGGDRDPGCWATIAAMRTCASSINGQLAELVAGLAGWSATVRQAAAGYDTADGHSGRRFGRVHAE